MINNQVILYEDKPRINNNNEYTDTPVMDPRKLDIGQSDKLTEWKNEPSILELKADLEYARQENTDQVGNVDGWLALRNTTGKESGNKTTAVGRSKTQPKLIRKHNEWRYPALSEPFLNTERMFKISPRTFEDKAAADQNQTVLNWQFDTKLNKVDLIDRYVRKTVDEGTCVVRLGWKRETERVLSERNIYTYFPLDLEDEEDHQAIQMLIKATELFNNEDAEYENLPEDLQASVEYSAENEIPVTATKSGVEQFYETKVTANQPQIDFCNIRNFFIDPSCEGIWENAQFMIYTYETTKSALKKRKIYKNLENVNWQSNAIKVTAGNPDHTSNSPQVDARINSDKCKVLVYEYWGLYDIHDDGIMVPIVVSWIGDTIIQGMENPFPDKKPPFVIVPYMPILDSAFGEADASLLQDNQRVLGAVNRGMIDLLARSANAQTGYAKGFLDPVNKKRFVNGDDFEFNPGGNPEHSIKMLKYPEIPNSALQIAAQQNAEAEGLSGVKSFSGGITGEAYGRVARGITGAMDAAGQREMSILRRLAEGMRLIGIKIISMNAKFLEETEVIRVTNEEFIDVKRADLAGNFDMIVDISTQNVDEAKAQDLGMMLQTMGPDMDPGLSKEILAEIAELKRMPHLAKKIRDYQSQPDPMAEQLRQLQIEELMSKVELNQARAKEAMARAENTDMETDLEASGTKHERNVEAQGAQAKGNRSLEVTKSLLAGQSGVGNIEAAVGFNKLTELEEGRNSQYQPPIEPVEIPEVPLEIDPALPL